MSSAINLEFGRFRIHRPVKMPIDFGAMTVNFKVTECTKVKFAFQLIS